SRRRHTRCLSDWSSDVCSSDLTPADASERLIEAIRRSLPPEEQTSLIGPLRQVATLLTDAKPANDRAACGRLDAFIDQVNAKERSEERRVGKGGGSGRSACRR